MHVSGTSWPKVKSITINGGQNNAQLILPEGTTTLNSNVTVKDWLTILPEPKEKRMICATIDVQNYKFTVDGTHGYKTVLGYIFAYDSNGNPGTGNLTIKNLEADGITYNTENMVMPYCDVRIEKGLAGIYHG